MGFGTINCDAPVKNRLTVEMVAFNVVQMNQKLISLLSELFQLISQGL